MYSHTHTHTHKPTWWCSRWLALERVGMLHWNCRLHLIQYVGFLSLTLSCMVVAILDTSQEAILPGCFYQKFVVHLIPFYFKPTDHGCPCIRLHIAWSQSRSFISSSDNAIRFRSRFITLLHDLLNVLLCTTITPLPPSRRIIKMSLSCWLHRSHGPPAAVGLHLFIVHPARIATRHSCIRKSGQWMHYAKSSPHSMWSKWWW